ncbi:MAG TPA: homoserine O-acetyltransferase [Luteibaculaceae bacterium]|nr:homoserine O-acetyltransferase [Luteibaculaceae bacterium]
MTKDFNISTTPDISQRRTAVLDGAFELECGESLNDVVVTYHTMGSFTGEERVIWVCHALTADSDVSKWWPGLFGPGDDFDRSDCFVICANVLGSCYGTTGPSLPNADGKRMLHHFPLITPRDMARAHQHLARKLGIAHIDLLIGGSLGGMQAMEWAIEEPHRIRQLVLIATNAKHSAFGIAFNESQRLALEADPSFVEGLWPGGEAGLRAARSMALLSYRGYEAYNQTQTDHQDDLLRDFRAASYQRYQGDKLVKRFDAYAYYTLTRAMDSHNIARGRGSQFEALQQIKADTLVVAISSDLLFPPEEQVTLANGIPNAQLRYLYSDFAHDGFLIETRQLSQLLQSFLVF